MTAERSMSPFDALSWAVALHPDALAVGEAVAAATWSLDAGDAAIGARLESLGCTVDPDFGVVGEAIVWIDAAEQGNSRWDGSTGTVIRPRCLLETTHGERYGVELPIRVARVRPPHAQVGHRLLVLGDPRP